LDRQTEDTLRELAERLGPADFDATLNTVTKAAVELLPHVDYASLTVKHRDGTVHSYATTDDILVDLDRTQDELQEGPCYFAITESPHVISRDLRVDSRFPGFGRAAVEVGILSQAGLRLFKTGEAVAALDLYSTQTAAFEDLSRLDRLFAHQAATALSYARELDNLHEALKTRTVIGQAVGILMERYGLEDQQAFAFLTRLSSTRHVKLRQIAEEIVADRSSAKA
jgi:GAF domain-containing protein